MTLQIFDTNSVGSGTRGILGTTDDAYVDTDVLVGSADSDAIWGTGSNHTVLVEGRVVGGGDAISLGNAADIDMHERIVVGNNGLVASDQSYGIYVTANNSSLTNRGVIQGDTGGIGFSGDGVGSSTIINDGEIYGKNQGIVRNGSEDFKVINNGLISTIDGYTYQGFDATGDQTLVNNGRIIGGVYLGDGNDTYRGTAGRIIDGTVSGDFGNDRLIGGKTADFLQGDQGRDIVTGGMGADHFIFARVEDSTLNQNGRDFVTDFHHSQHDILDFAIIDASDVGTNDAFNFIGKHGFSGDEGELRIKYQGASTFILGDTDGDRHADFSVELKGHLTLSAGDFLL